MSGSRLECVKITGRAGINTCRFMQSPFIATFPSEASLSASTVGHIRSHGSCSLKCGTSRTFPRETPRRTSAPKETAAARDVTNIALSTTGHQVWESLVTKRTLHSNYKSEDGKRKILSLSKIYLRPSFCEQIHVCRFFIRRMND